MRFLSLLVAVTACTDSWGHDISVLPASGPPLGVGLVQTYTVTQDLCESGINGDGGCDPTSPDQIAVSIASGSAASVGGIGGGTFELLGVAEGSSTVEVTGMDDAKTELPVAVATVAKTNLFAEGFLDERGNYIEVPSPVQAFVSTKVTIGQKSFGPSGDPRSGMARLLLAAGSTGVAVDATCNCYATGTTTGAAQITTPLASLELDVVDAAALADFSAGVPELTAYLDLNSDGYELVPTDTAGRTILGAGPDATVQVADPSLLTAYTTDDGASRSIALNPIKEGTTSLQITWGAVTKTFTVTVTRLGI